jgi:hypothetical protein
VNQGGEQGHDDYGLPRVDIDIPDDARELFRDVQAYHRELRAIRRQQRSLRWRAPFRRTGVAIPLLAGSLIIALLAVMVSAMLTVNPYLGGPKTNRSSSVAGNAGNSVSTKPPAGTTPAGTAPASTPPVTPTPGGGSVAARLPGKTINVAGKPLALSKLTSTALAIVPANCGCARAVRSLLEQAASAGITIYLVAPRGSSSALERLASAVGGSRASKVATDDANVLTAAYQPIGLTVLLVDSHGLVTKADKLGPRPMLEKRLELLKPSG